MVLQTLDTVADLVKSLLQSQSDAVSSVQIQLQVTVFYTCIFIIASCSFYIHVDTCLGTLDTYDFT